MTTVAELFRKRQLLAAAEAARARDRAWTGTPVARTWTAQRTILVWDQVRCTSCGTIHPPQAGAAFLMEVDSTGATRKSQVTAIDPELPRESLINHLALPFCSTCTSGATQGANHDQA